MIIVRYLAVDGYRQTRTFKTLAGARAYAQKWVGKFPELGSDYAVSFDGIGTIRVAGGATLRELFPEEPLPEPDPHDTWAAEQARLDALDEEKYPW
jgi:hypothetical protein